MFWLNLAMLLTIPFRDGLLFHQEYVACPETASCLSSATTHPNAEVMPIFYPMPVGTPVASAMETPYQLSLRFLAGPKDQIPSEPVNLSVNPSEFGCPQQIVYQMNRHAATGKLSLVVHRSDKGMVRLEMHYAYEGKQPWKGNACETLPLNACRAIPLKGDCPEPCLVEVTLTRPQQHFLVTLPPAMTMPLKPNSATLPMPSIAPCAAVVPMPAPSLVPCAAAVPMPAPMIEPLAMPTACSMPDPLPCPVPVHSHEVCSIVTPSLKPGSVTTFKLIRDGDKSRLQMSNGTSSCMAMRLTLNSGEAGSLTFAVGKTRIHLIGKEWRAQADTITLREDGTLTLKGHAKLTSEKLGPGASVQAEELSIQVKQGQFERILPRAKPTPVSANAPKPTTRP